MAKTDPRPFAFPLLARVQLPDAKGEGVIVERSQRANGPTRYRVRYFNSNGKPAEIKATEPGLLNGAAPKRRGRPRKSRGKS